ncbi:hypothetical protein PaecuDRAFT_0102 [Paenibacillus curdlanolyticus YK9]|uniref:Uncharacterized protein n=1 Tax=Paenibacillus curdlanolyticus YK9 TaxID=717606 RepID=E0I4R0_9BACL|nr:DUF6022 family protein [Paenibacillus curdlanolyticus]EFM12591.1 hypothetical protein PaecuDRAFT_0102 [Paenibacillus curdlanolyticus YK9]
MHDDGNPKVMKAIVRAAQQALSTAWREVYEEQRAEWEEMFKQWGDRAYGVWIQRFMPPIVEQLALQGWMIKGGFNRRDSIENWGPPEERERCAWYVIASEEGEPLGTLILQIYHSHRSFRLPRAPRFLALDVTEREEIIAALANAATRERWDMPEERLSETELAGQGKDVPRWEYATDVAISDCLQLGDDGQVSSWTLDAALAHWGRYGWELVSVLPSGTRTVAFFKRPAPA